MARVAGPYCLGPRTGNQEPRAVGIGPHTVDLLPALPEPNQRWLVLLGPRSVDQQQGLLRLISIVEIEAYGPHPPIIGPRVSDHGPIVLDL